MKKYTAKKVPFSSIVGQSVTLREGEGPVEAQIIISVPNPRFEYKETAVPIADQLVEWFNAPSASGGLEAETVTLTRQQIDGLLRAAYPLATASERAGALDAALAVPAATSAETQGGDGVREIIAERLARETVISAVRFLNDEASEVEHENYVLANWKAEIDAATKKIAAALAPSTSAATRGEPDMRRVCEALGFDPANHHNAAKCPYCTPAPAVESAQVTDVEDAILACERGNTVYDVLANYRAVRRTIQDIRASLDLATDAEG